MPSIAVSDAGPPAWLGEAFPTLLRMRMEDVGLSGGLLAQLLGVNLGTVAAWTKGEATPDAAKLWDLCDVIDVEPAAVLWSLRGQDVEPESAGPTGAVVAPGNGVSERLFDAPEGEGDKGDDDLDDDLDEPGEEPKE